MTEPVLPVATSWPEVLMEREKALLDVEAMYWVAEKLAGLTQAAKEKLVVEVKVAEASPAAPGVRPLFISLPPVAEV